jgi:hypothetical protein
MSCFVLHFDRDLFASWWAVKRVENGSDVFFSSVLWGVSAVACCKCNDSKCIFCDYRGAIANYYGNVQNIDITIQNRSYYSLDCLEVDFINGT